MARRVRLALLGAALLLALGGLALAVRARAPRPQGVPPHAWPPVVGQPYPDLELPDARGRPVRLSSLRGKVVVVQPVAMGSVGSQAHAGAHRLGGFDGVKPRPDFASFDELLDLHAGGLLWQSTPDLVYVHLLLYDLSGERAPTLEEGARWARHFDLDRIPNARVLVGDARYVNDASAHLALGFYTGVQVIDRRGVLRWDAAGWHAPHRLEDEALAGIPALLAER